MTVRSPERVRAMDLDANEDLTAIGKIMRGWSTWVLVVLFGLIALCMALTGTLDDWIRAVLAACFGGIAVLLGARAIMATGGRTGLPPETELDPPPAEPTDAG